MVLGSKVLVAAFFCLAFLLSLTKLLRAVLGRPNDETSEAESWLEEQNLTEFQTYFREKGESKMFEERQT